MAPSKKIIFSCSQRMGTDHLWVLLLHLTQLQIGENRKYEKNYAKVSSAFWEKCYSERCWWFISEIYGMQLNGILKIINNNSEYFTELMFFLKEINWNLKCARRKKSDGLLRNQRFYHRIPRILKYLKTKLFPIILSIFFKCNPSNFPRAPLSPRH